ncbi:hypothetical protein MB14_06860 [Roseivirga ehrenbergii]|uniref:Uncharacterized protein n=2 Tax=Roseivirga ehrenbergii (strain DSM 102268 / JCM 13514 / KCTC 12282 / NCIMB 14502 / KMM 6017) TaxID=279360 RepID=A0A150X850_ROSEK|nr:hypothetical protein MB14_06860 [Roseivirga ehrenbergii]
MSFLFVVGVLSAQSLLAQNNFASHQFVVILPELATLEIQNQSNITQENLHGVSLSYTGSVMLRDDFNKVRNLQVEVKPNRTSPTNQYLEMALTDNSKNSGILHDNQKIKIGSPVDFALFPLGSEGELQKSEINFSYKLLEESEELNASGTFDVVYTLSDI